MEWQCVGHSPTAWVLGVRVGDEMVHAAARCVRQPDGSWNWQTSLGQPGIGWGNEPSLEHAMQAAQMEVGPVQHVWAIDPERPIHRCAICGLEKSAVPDADKILRSVFGAWRREENP